MEAGIAQCVAGYYETAAEIGDVAVQRGLRAIVQRHHIQCDLAWSGSEQLAGDDAEWNEIREGAEALRAEGVRVDLDPARCAAVYADDGEMHPVRFVRGLADAAESLGARIHEGTTAAAVHPDRVVASGGTVRAGAVVLCTNAYTRHVAGDVRVIPIRGQMLATAPIAARVFPRPVYAHRGYRYWRQTRDGRVLVGGWRDTAVDAETGEEASTTEGIQRHLDAFLGEHGVRAPVTHRWGGIMGFSHDALPYIGSRADGMYLCAGFSGHGNAFAVAAGEIVASLIRSGGHPDADLFDPERP